VADGGRAQAGLHAVEVEPLDVGRLQLDEPTTADERKDVEAQVALVRAPGLGSNRRLGAGKPLNEIRGDRLSPVWDGEPIFVRLDDGAELTRGLITRLCVHRSSKGPTAVIERHATFPATVGTAPDVALSVAALASHLIVPPVCVGPQRWEPPPSLPAAGWPRPPGPGRERSG
jgi:hypothetical protein